MIVATMFGGPRDGLEIVVQQLTPLVFPITSGSITDWMLDPDNNPEPTTSTVTYVPRRDTLQDCPYCTKSEGFGHKRCSYYVEGWGR